MMIGSHKIIQAAIFLVHSIAIQFVKAFALVHVNSLTINVNAQNKQLSGGTATTESHHICRYAGKYHLMIVETMDNGLIHLPERPFMELEISVRLAQDALVLEEDRLLIEQQYLGSYRSSLRQLWNHWFQDNGFCLAQEEPKVASVHEEGSYLLEMALQHVGSCLHEQFLVCKLMAEGDPLCCQIEAAGQFASTLMIPSEEMSSVQVIEKAASNILAGCTLAELLNHDNVLVLQGEQGALYFQRGK